MTPFLKTLGTSVINIEIRKVYSNKTRSDCNSSKIVIGKKHMYCNKLFDIFSGRMDIKSDTFQTLKKNVTLKMKMLN